jgi:hypothetical protein
MTAFSAAAECAGSRWLMKQLEQLMTQLRARLIA